MILRAGTDSLCLRVFTDFSNGRCHIQNRILPGTALDSLQLKGRIVAHNRYTKRLCNVNTSLDTFDFCFNILGFEIRTNRISNDRKADFLTMTTDLLRFSDLILTRQINELNAVKAELLCLITKINIGASRRLLVFTEAVTADTDVHLFILTFMFLWLTRSVYIHYNRPHRLCQHKSHFPTQIVVLVDFSIQFRQTRPAASRSPPFQYD